MTKDDPMLRIRLPVQVKAWLASAATLNRRSMSKEVEFLLETAMRAENAGAPAAGNASQA